MTWVASAMMAVGILAGFCGAVLDLRGLFVAGLVLALVGAFAA